MSNSKVNYLIFFSIALILLIFDFYKAAHASFTYDESYSWLHYINMNVVDILSYKDNFTNNHILNSLLMKFFNAVFGNSELSMRLPNIVAHIVYLFFTFKLINHFCPDNFSWIFILMNANPFLLDFFSLARGYGLAIGLMTAGLYFYCRFIENEENRNHLLALIFVGFASLANFALLTVFLMLIVLQNFFFFFVNRHSFSLRNTWRANKFNLIVVFSLAVIIYEPICKIIRLKLIDFGGTNGIWNDTVTSLLVGFAYNASYGALLITFLKIVIISAFFLFLFWSIKYSMKLNLLTAVQKCTLFFVLLVLLILLGSITQHLLLGTPFLKYRYALFIYPLFILAGSFLMCDLMDGPGKFLKKGFLMLLSFVFLVHTCYAENIHSYYEWVYDSDTKTAVVIMKETIGEEAKPDQKTSLGNSWLFEPTINYYRTIYSMNYLEKSTRDQINKDADLIYLTDKDTNQISYLRYKYTEVQRFPESESVLFKRQTDAVNTVSVIHLKASNGKFLCTERDHLIRANRESPHLWETYTLTHLKNSMVSLGSYEKLSLCIELNSQCDVIANKTDVGKGESFTLLKLENEYVAFRAANGKYLGMDGKSFQLVAKSDSIGSNEKFTLITE